ncbi:MAG TPA: hypothetical protein VGQ17_03785 [Gemmatimonadales bacterium]|jgi:hypothetical protein|nr:hypothetical protein [Gemmatimonadales bacterium]
MPTSRGALSLLSLVALGSALGAGRASAQKPPKPDRDLITREELAEADAKFPDLFQAIMRLRPRFLSQNRGIRTMGIQPGSGSALMCDAVKERNCAQRQIVQAPVSPVIYLDGMKSGDPDVLKGIRTGGVEEVRYLTPSRAAMEYGLGHDGGAILVKLDKGTKP